jgi:CPA2 family monovalent cation:H+ antiporter-2
MSHPAITQILVLLLAAVLVVSVFRRLHLPPILGYLVVGMLLGPHALGLATDAEATRTLADFGVVFLVFTLGLEFSLPRLIAMRWEVLGLGGGQVVITAAGAALIAWLLGVPPAVAAVLGGAVAMSSTALVLRQLGEQSELNRTHGHLAIAILLFQDLAFVPFLAVAAAISTGGRPDTQTLILTTLIQGGLALAIVLVAGRLLVRPLFHEIARSRTPELFLLAVLLIALGSAWATESVGLSLALGAFLAGVMLAETEFRHQVEVVIRPFRDILLGLFFITVGMLLDIGLLGRNLLLVTALLLALLIGKTLVVTLLARSFSGNNFKALRTGIVVSVGGEFGFALLTILLQGTLVDARAVQPLLAAIVLSMVASPILIRHNKRIARWILRESGPAETSLAREQALTQAVAARDHVLICGYGRVGQNIGHALQHVGFEYLAIDLDPVRVRTARQAGEPVIYGDAGQTEVLENVGLKHVSVVVISFSDPALAIRIVGAVRQQRRDVPILVRTQDDSRLVDLQRSGATSIVPETFEAALMLIWHTLLLLKVPVTSVMKTIGEIRSHRYGRMRELIPRGEAPVAGGTEGYEDELHTFVLPPGAWAVGRTIQDLRERGANLNISAIRRDDIVGRDPSDDTVLREGDVLVLYGKPDALAHGEDVLLMG